jgi:3-hydroxyisobutyrate dehydrogenase
MGRKVGFIGLGAIGRPMAVHVAKAFDTMVWNRTAATAHAFSSESGAQVAVDPAAVVGWADVVITCLPTSVEVREVVERAGDAWREGQLLVDCTSGDPTGSREIAEWLADRGVAFVDAPVSGGTSGAEAGTLTVMLGGEDADVRRALEFVDPFAGKAMPVGPIGAGHALKAINNALLAINIQAAGEGLAALVKLGVKAQTALDVINASSGRSNVTENLFGERVVTRAWPRTFRLALLDKDVGIALKVLQDTGVPHDAIGVAKAVYAAGRKALGEEADHVELVKEIEKRAGVEIRYDGQAEGRQPSTERAMLEFALGSLAIRPDPVTAGHRRHGDVPAVVGGAPRVRRSGGGLRCDRDLDASRRRGVSAECRVRISGWSLTRVAAVRRKKRQSASCTLHSAIV